MRPGLILLLFYYVGAVCLKLDGAISLQYTEILLSPLLVIPTAFFVSIVLHFCRAIFTIIRNICNGDWKHVFPVNEEYTNPMQKINKIAEESENDSGAN